MDNFLINSLVMHLAEEFAALQSDQTLLHKGTLIWDSNSGGTSAKATGYRLHHHTQIYY